MESRVLRLKEVEKMVGYKRSSIYAMMAKGEFPQRRKIGTRRVVWIKEEIEQWLH